MRRLFVLAALCAPAARGGLTVDDQAVDLVTNAYGSCIRFYGQNGYVGCSTQNGGDGVEGDLFGVLEPDDVTGLSQSLATGVRRAVVVWQKLLTPATMNVLVANAARVAGVLVIQSTTDPKGAVPSAFSPAAPGNNNFNAGGFDWLDKSFPFPISLIQQSQAESLVQKTLANRRAASTKAVLPIHKAKLAFYQGPSLGGKMNATTCMGWININGNAEAMCEPIAGQSVWGWRNRSSTTAPPTPTPVVLAVAQMDARSLLYGHMPGVDGSASGLVALLVAAEALKAAPIDTSKTIAYAAFQGEAWHHMGSRAFVDDVNQFDCAVPTNQTQDFGPTPCLKPLVASTTFQQLNNASKAPIETVVGVDNVGVNAGSGGEPLRMHYADAASKTSATTSGVPTATSAGIPASSPAATFEDYRSVGGAAPHRLVLGRYDGDFSAAQNPYFGSHLDTSDRVTAASVKEAAEQLAIALYKLAGGNSAFNPAVSETRVSTLLNCITAVEGSKGWSCAEMDTAVSEQLNNLPTFESRTGQYEAKQMAAFQRNAVPLGPSAVPRKNMDLYANTLFAPGFSRLPQLMPIKADANSVWKQYNFYPSNPDNKTREWLDSSSKRTIIVFPNRLEIFVYALLSNATGSTAQDPRTWYHNAISRAVVLPEDGSTRPSEVNRGVSAAQQATLWAEPVWQQGSQTVTLYVDGGSAIAWIALASGLVVALLGLVGAKLTLSFFGKEHVL